MTQTGLHPSPLATQWLCALQGDRRQPGRSLPSAPCFPRGSPGVGSKSQSGWASGEGPGALPTPLPQPRCAEGCGLLGLPLADNTPREIRGRCWGSAPGEEPQSHVCSPDELCDLGHSMWGREQHPSPARLAWGQLEGVQCGHMVTLLAHAVLPAPRSGSQGLKSPKAALGLSAPPRSLVPCQEACQRRPTFR